MESQKTISMADRVFERLEDDILSGKYAPGEILTELKLCAELQVSRTPVREALKRLMQENLIHETGKGMAVCSFDEEDINDIYEIRSRIEGLAFSVCAGKITDDELKKLHDTLELQHFYATRHAPDGVRDTDSEFHKLVYEYCGSRTLLEILENLHRKVRRFRRLSVENDARAEAAAREHEQIYEALAAHDSEKAERLATEHIKNARDSILAAVHANKEN